MPDPFPVTASGSASASAPGPVSASLLHHLAVLGTQVPVDLAGAPDALVERFRAVWAHCLVEPGTAGTIEDPNGGPNGGPTVLSTIKGELDAELAPDIVARALMRLTQDVTKAAIARQAGRALMFHAGALAHPESGATIVYVAPGGTGKTTLSRTLGTELAYVTDETVAVVDGDVVLPYPKPLSVRRVPHLGVKDELPPAGLGLLPIARHHAEPWVAGIVLLARDDRHPGAVEIEHLDPLDAIARLAPETSSLGRLDRPLHLLADLIERTGGVRVAHYSEAATLRPLVHEVTGGAR
jgi:hypothetical protein